MFESKKNNYAIFIQARMTSSRFPNKSLKNIEGTPVRVIDVNGRTVLKTTISSDSNINVETLTNGVYFVQLQVENKDLSYKFVKK